MWHQRLPALILLTLANPSSARASQTLTGLHTLAGCIGSYIALERGHFVRWMLQLLLQTIRPSADSCPAVCSSQTPARLSVSDNVKLALFSVLYTVNIAVSNVSLQLVTVPVRLALQPLRRVRVRLLTLLRLQFHQVVRASAPLFIIAISVLFFKQRISNHKLLSLLPVMAGVGLAYVLSDHLTPCSALLTSSLGIIWSIRTYGDYYFTIAGLLLTLLGTFLAALKTVMTNVIQTGGGGRLKLHPLDLLMRMSPLAFVQCVVYSWSSGELDRVRHYGAVEMTRTKVLALLVNGSIAFGLNVVSFTANKKTSALTMSKSLPMRSAAYPDSNDVVFDASFVASLQLSRPTSSRF